MKIVKFKRLPGENLGRKSGQVTNDGCTMLQSYPIAFNMTTSALFARYLNAVKHSLLDSLMQVLHVNLESECKAIPN